MTDSLSENLPEQDQISSPGTVLKRCREYHGISLAEAAEATKIGVNYLTALENGKPGNLQVSPISRVSCGYTHPISG